MIIVHTTTKTPNIAISTPKKVAVSYDPKIPLSIVAISIIKKNTTTNNNPYFKYYIFIHSSVQNEKTSLEFFKNNSPMVVWIGIKTYSNSIIDYSKSNSLYNVYIYILSHQLLN